MAVHPWACCSSAVAGSASGNSRSTAHPQRQRTTRQRTAPPSPQRLSSSSKQHLSPRPTHTPPANGRSRQPPALPQPDALQLLITAENNLLTLTSFSHQRSITINTPPSTKAKISLHLPGTRRWPSATPTAKPSPSPATPTCATLNSSSAAVNCERANSQAAWQELPPDNTNYLEAYTGQLRLSPTSPMPSYSANQP
ncbi:MAG: hypothetical protein H6658_19410 [Ardenticatenaceae bacterium]|nr:hypothetical protein [Ardenticatenaceae bacterium]